jgi:nitronate monooxygenase
MGTVYASAITNQPICILQAGVDGLIAVCAGAGGHAGTVSPMAFIPQLRKRFQDKILVAAGAIGDGATIRAVQVLGADFAYIGTRLIATEESLSPKEYKSMLVNEKSGPPPSFLPVVYTNKVSGVHANFLRQSLLDAGLSPEKLAHAEDVHEDFSKLGTVYFL